MKLIETKWEGKAVLAVDLPKDKDGNTIGKPFSFGVAKAQVIVDNIDVIKDFVKKHSQPQVKGKTISKTELTELLNRLGYIVK